MAAHRKNTATTSSRPTTPRQARAWPRVVFALLLGVVVGAAAMRLQMGDAAKRYDDLKVEFDIVAAQHAHDLNQALMKADAAQGQLTVEQSTRKALEATLSSTQQELGRAREQLAFFNQLLPPGPSGAISIRGLDFIRTGPTLTYKVLLMRNAQGGEPFNGLMEFVANGSQNGKAVKMKLESALANGPVAAAKSANGSGAETNSSPLALSFEQFQRSEGVLSVPEGFEPSSVTLNILDGNTVRVSRTVKLANPR